MLINPVDQGTQLLGRGSEYLERLNLDQVSEPLGGDKQGKVDDKVLPGSLIKGGGATFGQRSFGDVLGGPQQHQRDTDGGQPTGRTAGYRADGKPT